MRITTENTAKSGGGSYIKFKLTDILDPKPQDTRTGQEIIDGIRKKL